METSPFLRSLRLLLLLALAAAAVAGARAQAFPNGAISLVVPVAAGDAADIAGRSLAAELSRILGVPVVVRNRPGAGAVIGAAEVARAKKDGYTLLFAVNSALTFRPVLDPKTVAYDPQRDLAPLGFATRTPAVLAVRSDSRYADFAQLLAEAKRSPGSVTIGTAGAGSSGHIAVATIAAQSGAEFSMVPYTGASPAVTGLAGGFVDAVVVSLGAIAGQLRAGTLRGILASSRFPEFPALPTLSSLGYGEDFPGVWMGFFAPQGLPDTTTGALLPAIERAVLSPAVAARLLPLGMVQEYRPPDAVAEEIRREQRAIAAVARKAKLIP